jgi:hypothetical protein
VLNLTKLHLNTVIGRRSERGGIRGNKIGDEQNPLIGTSLRKLEE